MTDYEHLLRLCMDQGQLLAELHGHLSCLLESGAIADWACPMTAELTARAKDAYQAPLFPRIADALSIVPYQEAAE